MYTVTTVYSHEMYDTVHSVSTYVVEICIVVVYSWLLMVYAPAQIS